MIISRYFCSHNAGIHVVNLPMVSQLEEYVSTKGGKIVFIDKTQLIKAFFVQSTIKTDLLS